MADGVGWMARWASSTCLVRSHSPNDCSQLIGPAMQSRLPRWIAWTALAGLPPTGTAPSDLRNRPSAPTTRTRLPFMSDALAIGARHRRLNLVDA